MNEKDRQKLIQNIVYPTEDDHQTDDIFPNDEEEIEEFFDEDVEIDEEDEETEEWKDETHNELNHFVGQNSPPKKLLRKSAGKSGFLKKGFVFGKKAMMKLGLLLVKGAGFLLKAAGILLGGISLSSILIGLLVIGIVVITVLVGSAISADRAWMEDVTRQLDDNVFSSAGDMGAVVSNRDSLIEALKQRWVNIKDWLGKNLYVSGEYEPNELILAAVSQTDILQLSADVSHDRGGDVVENVGQLLKPQFTFEEHNAYSEFKTTECWQYEDGEECEVIHEERVDNWIPALARVDAWNRVVDYQWRGQLSDWYVDDVETRTETITYETTEIETYQELVKVEKTCERIETYTEYELVCDSSDKPWLGPRCHIEKVEKTRVVEYDCSYYKLVEKTREVIVEKEKEIEVVTTTERRDKEFSSNKQEFVDFTLLNNALNSLGMGMNDKRLVEVNYYFASGNKEELGFVDWLENNGGNGGGFSRFPGTIQPGAGIPPEFMQYYLDAEAEYGVDWYVLAAMHSIESNFSDPNWMVSHVGALGPMQFMPCSWIGWAYGGCMGSLGSLPYNLIKQDLENVDLINRYGGYGVDANGDGRADIWDTEDAIHTAAKYLARNGYHDNKATAVFAYNHSYDYVQDVLGLADIYKNAATYVNDGEFFPKDPGGMFARPSIGMYYSGFGMRSSGFHYGLDITPEFSIVRDNDIPVVAAEAGEVIEANYHSSAGNYITIRHNINGQVFYTRYLHLVDYRTVSVGDYVQRGQFIGLMGNTGNVRTSIDHPRGGTHLHFEIRINSNSKSNTINPAKCIGSSTCVYESHSLYW